MSNKAPAADKHAEKAAAEGAPGKKSLLKKIKIPLIILAVVALEWVAAMMFLPGGKSTPPADAHAQAEEDGEGAEGETAAASAEEGAEEKSTEEAGGEEAAASEGEGEQAADEPAHGGEHGATNTDEHGHAKPEEAGEHAAEGKGHGKEEKGHGGHGEKDAATAPKRASKAHTEYAEVDLGEFTVTVYQHASSSTQFISFHLFGTVKHKSVDDFNERLEESKHRIRDNILVIIRSAEMSDLTDAGLGLIKRRVLETTNKALGKPLLQGVIFSEFSFVEQ